MTKMNGKKDMFKEMLLRELVLEPALGEEFGLSELLEVSPEEGREQGPSVLSALDKGGSITDLGLEKALKKALKRKTLTAYTRSLAESLKSAKDDGRKYRLFCQVAVCDGVARAPARAAQSLQEAATIHDKWARHHHLMGLIQGLRENFEEARQELDMAIKKEPFLHGKVRISQALQHCDEALAAQR